MSSITMMQQLSSSLPDHNLQQHQSYNGIGPMVSMPGPPPPPIAPTLYNASNPSYPNYGMAPPPPAPLGYPPMPSMSGMGMGMGMVPPPPPAPLPIAPTYSSSNAGEDSEESKAKKARIEATTTLIPAEEFAASFTAPIDILIQLPQEPSMGQQWNLNGQVVKLSVAVLTSTKEIKEVLASQHLGNMPVGRFQLKHSIHGFLKDGNSLAALNLGSNTTLELTVKSRGGKR